MKDQLESSPTGMGVSIDEYRQRIGCFAGVATVLSSCKVRGNNSNSCRKQSQDSGTLLRVIIRCVDYAIKFQNRGNRETRWKLNFSKKYYCRAYSFTQKHFYLRFVTTSNITRDSNM